jgi:branched-chain amino acid transport system substrate-binding protein
MMKIGVLATLQGPFELLGKDAVRGAKLALAEFDHQVAGHPVELVVRATNAIGDSAVAAAADLLDYEGCDLIVGPLSGDEGIAIREFARRRPEHVFINGTSGSQALFSPAPNFFTFMGSGAQVIAGLGRYCYEVKGYRRVVTIGEGYSYPYTQVGAFGLEFSRAGGEIVDTLWCGIGTQDYSSYIAQIPADVDAVLSTLAVGDNVNFIQQYQAQGGKIPIMAGPGAGDASALHFLRDYADVLVGVIVAGPIADDLPEPGWVSFVERYWAAYPDGFYSPSEFAYAYYTGVKAALLALQQVEADLSDDRRYLKQALAELAFDTPTGPVRLDEHRIAIVNNFVSEITAAPDGTLYTHLIQKIPEVNCTLGLPEAEYLRLGDFTPQNIPGRRKTDSFMDRLRQFQRRGTNT